MVGPPLDYADPEGEVILGSFKSFPFDVARGPSELSRSNPRGGAFDFVFKYYIILLRSLDLVQMQDAIAHVENELKFTADSCDSQIIQAVFMKDGSACWLGAKAVCHQDNYT